MRLHRSFLTLVTLGLLAGLLCAAPAAAAYEFPRVDGLEGNVAFWRNVYAVWSENEIAFHDRKDFHIVYRVVKVPPRTDGKARRKAIVKARSELTAALKQLNKTQPKTGDGLEGVELEVWTNLKDIRHADKYRRLSTIRAQNGLRERFVAGYVSAGAYERQIRDRLALAGLPEEIVALAYLESLMDIRAVSHAGAVGMWQFMRPTAKEYMHVNNVVDERMDPIIAADAAAKYINQALKEVGPWPVAITSYNYGRAGMRRAIKGAGSDDLGVILKKFTSKRFGLPQLLRELPRRARRAHPSAGLPRRLRAAAGLGLRRGAAAVPDPLHPAHWQEHADPDRPGLPQPGAHPVGAHWR
jgi:membrane-bound lytic murein transglycosylase D